MVILKFGWLFYFGGKKKKKRRKKKERKKNIKKMKLYKKVIMQKVFSFLL
jgi:hypothetical protein